MKSMFYGAGTSGKRFAQFLELCKAITLKERGIIIHPKYVVMTQNVFKDLTRAKEKEFVMITEEVAEVEP